MLNDFGPLLTAYLLFLAFALGACLASFLACLAGRAAAGEKRPWRGRSHCDSCGRTLGPLDLVPVVSYLALRGRCRTCGAKIGATCLVTECLLGAVFVTVVWRVGLSPQALELMLLACALLYLSLIDLATMELPGLPMLIGAAGFLAFLPAHPDPLRRLLLGLAGAAAIGGGVLAVSLIADKVMGRETMGGGDIKLLALLGLYLGPGGGLLLVILACLTGLVLAFATGRGRGREFPFGPAIALAAWPAVLCSEMVLSWYLGLFSV